MKALRATSTLTRPALSSPCRLPPSTAFSRPTATPSRELAFFGWPWSAKGKAKEVEAAREEVWQESVMSTEEPQQAHIRNVGEEVELGSRSSAGRAPEAEDGPSQEPEIPWFVDRDYLDPAPAASPARRAPVPPPSTLPPLLHPLHAHLVDSPFFEADSIAYIDAKNEPDGMGDEAWAEWVVVAELRRGRERGIAGAADGVRQIMRTLALDRRPPRVEGVDNPRSEWAMVDAGPVLVHVVTADAREAFDIEGVWTGHRRHPERPQPQPQPLRMLSR